MPAARALEEPGAYVAGYTLVDPSQQHPIMVSQQPATLNLRVRARLAGPQRGPAPRGRRLSCEHFRNTGMGNSRLVIGVPAGSPNESAAMRAMGDVRGMIVDYGFSDTAVATEPYHGGRNANAPIRLSYLQLRRRGPGMRPLADQPGAMQTAQSARTPTSVARSSTISPPRSPIPPICSGRAR